MPTLVEEDLIMSSLKLDLDELLTTTRAVRNGSTRSAVERAIIEECLRIALQAPTGGNRQQWHFVVVTDPGQAPRDRRSCIGRAGRVYLNEPDGRRRISTTMTRPARPVQRRVGGLGPVPRRQPRATCRSSSSRASPDGSMGSRASDTGRHLGIALAGRLEFHARRARPRARHGVDDCFTCVTNARSPRLSASLTTQFTQGSADPGRATRVGDRFQASASTSRWANVVHWDSW